MVCSPPPPLDYNARFNVKPKIGADEMTTEPPPPKPDGESIAKDPQALLAGFATFMEKITKFNKHTDELHKFGKFVVGAIVVIYGVVIPAYGFIASKPIFIPVLLAVFQMAWIFFLSRKGRKRNVENWLFWSPILAFVWSVALIISIHYLPPTLTVEAVATVFIIAVATLMWAARFWIDVITYLLQLKLRAYYAYHLARLDSVAFFVLHTFLVRQLTRVIAPNEVQATDKDFLVDETGKLQEMVRLTTLIAQDYDKTVAGFDID
jgi:hypothetical protein